MKFNLGHWALVPGTQAVYPVSIVDVRTEPDALVVVGYSRGARGRGDCIGGTTVEARFTSPMPGAIRVQLSHFKGRRQKRPAFDLDYTLENPGVSVGRDEREAWLKAGSLSVVVPLAAGSDRSDKPQPQPPRISLGEWRFAFRRDGEPLTESEPRAVGLFTRDGETYLREQLSLRAGETVYGLGERFGPLVKNGQSIDSWNEDSGTDTELAYKNVPFYMTSRGYGVLVNHPGRVSFEVASHQTSRVQFSVADHSLDYYVFGGPNMKAVLEQYTALSGRPAMPPEWSFGLWLSTSFVTNYDEAAILGNIERMESLGIPISVFHFDCFWMQPLTWCSFLWDERNFPDPAGMLARIKAKGIKVCVWINPYIAEASPLFAEGAANGYLLLDLEGNVYQEDEWQPGMAFVDFTNPVAREWYVAKLRALVDLGVDTFKTDFGEKIPTAVRYHDGSDPERMHNYYTYLYNKTVFDLLRREKGEGEAVVFARSATCGGQKFPVHWGGDCTATYASMAESLRGGLSFGMSGFGFWSHDIGGFIGTATPDLYKRWVAFGLLSSHSRLHGNDSVRMPWLFDDEAVDVLRFFVGLKKRLMPYLLDVAREATEHGWPMMRAMALEFPDDPACRYLDMQYMLGPALLVAPVFAPSGEATYYVPQGEWSNLLTGETIRGGAWRNETHSFMSLPLWVHTERARPWECLKKEETSNRH